MTGNVHMEQSGPQPMQGRRRARDHGFRRSEQLQKVHAVDGVRITQKAAQAEAKPAGKGVASSPQDFEITAPIIDFRNCARSHSGARRNFRRRADHDHASAGIRPRHAAELRRRWQASCHAFPDRTTVVTAGKFDAQFAYADGRDRITNVHGAPNARIVNSAPGQPDRVSTSDSVDAAFLPKGGIDFVTQLGNVAYADGQQPDKRMQAWANSARYTPSDQMLVLTGSPRVTNGGMATTANSIRMNRATGDALAQGDVKSTYSDLKEQPDGALLASSSPIHVTAQSMTAHNTPGTSLYSGNARLWQDANIIEAPTIQFDRDRRFVTAQGTPAQPVQTILVQTEKVQAEKVQGETGCENLKGTGKSGTQGSPLGGSSPISITAAKLTYADSERKAHYEGGVDAKGADFTATAKTADAYLVPRSQTSEIKPSEIKGLAGPGQLDHMVAQGRRGRSAAQPPMPTVKSWSTPPLTTSLCSPAGPKEPQHF
jgi:lipopolysaccharide export system protein LptA